MIEPQVSMKAVGELDKASRGIVVELPGQDTVGREAQAGQQQTKDGRVDDREPRPERQQFCPLTQGRRDAELSFIKKEGLCAFAPLRRSF